MLIMEQLKKRGFQLASRYPFVGRVRTEENLEHILIHCPLIWELWVVIFSTFGAIGMRPFLVRDFLCTMVNFPVRKHLRFLWMVVPLSFGVHGRRGIELSLKIPRSLW